MREEKPAWLEVDMDVEYWSNSTSAWLPTKVLAVETDVAGTAQVTVKRHAKYSLLRRPAPSALEPPSSADVLGDASPADPISSVVPTEAPPAARASPVAPNYAPPKSGPFVVFKDTFQEHIRELMSMPIADKACERLRELFLACVRDVVFGQFDPSRFG